MTPSRSAHHAHATRKLAAFAGLALGGLLAPGCLDRPIERIEPRTTSVLAEAFTETKVDKIDLLLMIDDSRSMADKQAILARAVPDLIGSLVNPPCRSATGQVIERPDGPLATCPAGSWREFEPVLDLHLGIITSSLGARGGSVGALCSDDHGRLVHREIAEDGTVSDLPTHAGLGFLAWDPAQALDPPGQTDAASLVGDVARMVRGVGQDGCGYEAQLESWYRFLVDPEPYAEVKVGDDDQARLVDVDGTLLEQRAAFLRPDSLVAIIMLTDENDCSFRPEGFGYVTADNDANSRLYHRLYARSECATDPQDRCCAPCGHAPAECPADPSCDAGPPPDNFRTNLNCFAQKQRYGVDLLHPVERYVQGLTERAVADRAGNLVPNPLLVSPTGAVRPTDRVFLAGIVGVPWQDLAHRNDAGKPDLRAGLKSAAELAEDGTWELILGDPARAVVPLDPHMIESVAPRTGTNPVTGDRLASPDAPSASADPINGHEYVVPATDASGDLQYACIFDLPPEDQVVCEPGAPCDCAAPDPNVSHKPLCQEADGSYSNVQRRAKAYPGLRQLAVLRAVGERAIVGSICPQNMIDQDAPDYGYRPTIGALTERLAEQLRDPCLGRSFTPDESGQVGCVMLEGTKLGADESCTCGTAGRRPVPPEMAGAEVAAREHEVSELGALDCFCEIPQLAGAELAACQQTLGDEVLVAGEQVDGWCYVDLTIAPPIGAPELVEHCAEAEKRTIRFLGAGAVQPNATLFLTCQQEST